LDDGRAGPLSRRGYGARTVSRWNARTARLRLWARRREGRNGGNAMTWLELEEMTLGELLYYVLITEGGMH
jgi:hypothetical protein